VKTKIDFKRALCGAAIGAGIFSNEAGGCLLFTGESVARVLEAQTRKGLANGSSNASGLNDNDDFAKPELIEPKSHEQ